MNYLQSQLCVFFLLLTVFHAYLYYGVSFHVHREQRKSEPVNFLFKHAKTSVFDERGPFLMKTYSAASGSWQKKDFVAKLWTPKTQIISWNRKESGEQKKSGLRHKAQEKLKRFSAFNLLWLWWTFALFPKGPLLLEMNRKWEKLLV